MNGPVKLSPIRKEYIWGTEDWMLSGLHEGLEESPLLIKIIRAREALSVQVHPDDEFARENEQKSGKTEMWYVIGCEPGAWVYYGLKNQISLNEFKKRMQNQSITEVCRKVSVKPGDVFYIPAGTLHALGAGIDVVEIQQNSDVTYRIYDYNRGNNENVKRPLHPEKAAQVMGLMPALQGHTPMGQRIQKNGYSGTLLVQCPYFVVQYYEVETYFSGSTREGFQSLLILKGEGELSWAEGGMSVRAGESIYLPKDTGDWRLAGKLQFLLSEV